MHYRAFGTVTEPAAASFAFDLAAAFALAGETAGSAGSAASAAVPTVDAGVDLACAFRCASLIFSGSEVRPN